MHNEQGIHVDRSEAEHRHEFLVEHSRYTLFEVFTAGLFYDTMIILEVFQRK